MLLFKVFHQFRKFPTQSDLTVTLGLRKVYTAHVDLYIFPKELIQNKGQLMLLIKTN